MAITTAQVIDTNNDIANEIIQNRHRIYATLTNAQLSADQLAAMATTYGSYLTELRTQVGAMAGTEADYEFWKQELAKLESMVIDFNVLKTIADNLIVAITAELP